MQARKVKKAKKEKKQEAPEYVVKGTAKANKKKAKKFKRTEGLSRKAFKERNREIYNQVEGGNTKDIRKLYRAMKRNGVMALKSGDGISNQFNAMSAIGPHQQPMVNMNTHSGTDAINAFMKALQNPGVHDVPFIDANQVVPLPHGVMSGIADTDTADNTKYAVYYVCPAMAFATANNIAAQYSGFNHQAYTTTADVIAAQDIVGVPGDWFGDWGNTTAAQRIVPWSMALDISLRIPEAVVQGQFWVGNAPFRTVVASTLGNLIQMSESLNSEIAGLTYTIKASLTDRSLVHVPYGSLVNTATAPTTYHYPESERVSWIIFSPASAGTIGGPASPTIDIMCQPRCNYLWVPLFQPQVIGTTAGQVSADSHDILDPYRKARLENDSNVEATDPIERVSQMAKICPHISPASLQHKIEANSSSNAFSLANVADPLGDYGLYSSYVGDLEYYMNSMNTRWGEWDKMPATIVPLIVSVFDSMSTLREALLAVDADTRRLLQDFFSGVAERYFIHGKPVQKRISKSGKILTSEKRSKSTDSSVFSQHTGMGKR